MNIIKNSYLAFMGWDKKNNNYVIDFITIKVPPYFNITNGTCRVVHEKSNAEILQWGQNKYFV